MVKFVITQKNGPKLVGLGITEENVKRLKEGKPILVKGEEIEMEHDTVILYGKTEQDIAKEIQESLKGDDDVPGNAG